MTSYLEVARQVARAYWVDLGLPGVDRIEAPPVLGPVDLPGEPGARGQVAFRFIGPGRGGDYVQVELDPDAGTAEVHGAAEGRQQPTRTVSLCDQVE